MADIKVSGLPAAPDVQLQDVLHLVDTSSGLSTRATLEQLQAVLLQGLTPAMCQTLLAELIGCASGTSVVDFLNKLPGTFEGQTIVWDDTNTTWVLEGVPPAESFDIEQEDNTDILLENGDTLVQEIAP